jgi:hypothetical protein
VRRAAARLFTRRITEGNAQQVHANNANDISIPLRAFNKEETQLQLGLEKMSKTSHTT